MFVGRRASRSTACSTTSSPATFGVPAGAHHVSSPPHLGAGELARHGHLGDPPPSFSGCSGRARGGGSISLWITVACVAIPVLFYQNSGWIQFGYRFALDYLVFLLCLMALGKQRFTPTWKTLVLIGMAINFFGAITFHGETRFYFDGYFPPGID